MKAAITYNEPVPGRPDSEEVLDEVRYVTGALSSLGYDHKPFPVGGAVKTGNNGSSRTVGGTSLSLNENIFYLISRLKKYKPDIIINLVEGINDDPFYRQFFVLLFEYLKYPFTGSGYSSILTTSDKSVCKTLMKGFNIQSPDFNEYRGTGESITVPPPWIVKPALEDASIGVDASSLFHEKKTLITALPSLYKKFGGQPLVIEQFIQGREFNVSLLEKDGGAVEVLPVSEIVFQDWPVTAPMIVDYRAKWRRDSFEYRHTNRQFSVSDVRLDELKSTALKCWKVFKLKGYARVDMRISGDNEIYVLDVNANPRISQGSGYVSALTEAGYRATDFVKTLIEVARRHYE